MLSNLKTTALKACKPDETENNFRDLIRQVATLKLTLPTIALAMFLTGCVGAHYTAGVAVGSPPICPYGYYEAPPYACAPDGYYGPEWFSGGVFIGAGPGFTGLNDSMVTSTMTSTSAEVIADRRLRAEKPRPRSEGLSEAWPCMIFAATRRHGIADRSWTVQPPINADDRGHRRLTLFHRPS